MERLLLDKAQFEGPNSVFGPSEVKVLSAQARGFSEAYPHPCSCRRVGSNVGL